MTNELPNGWEVARLGDLGTEVRGQTSPEPGTTYDLYSVPAFPTGQPEQVDGESIRSGKRPVEEHDVLLCKINPRINRVWVVGPSHGLPQIASTEYLVLRPHEPRMAAYLRFFLSSPRFRDWIRLAVEGATGSHTRAKSGPILEQLVPVPPLAEQQRIALAIEEHLSRLDAAAGAACAAGVKAAASRRSILVEALSGRLSTQDQGDEPASMLLDRIAASGLRSKSLPSADEPQAQGREPASLWELPRGWAWAQLQDLIASEPRSITDGPFGSNLKTAHYTTTGPRVIRLQNIGDGEFKREDAHISPEHFESLRAHSVQSGDLIVASLGESLPRACLVPHWVPPAIVKADCIRVRLHSEVNRSYVNMALQDPRLRRATAADIKGVGRPRLGLRGIRQLTVPVPPRAEQDRIVDVIEAQFARLSAISGAVSAVMSKIEAMRRTVLAQAFAGRLVQQSPSDEPASVMLDRIGAGAW